MSIRDMEGIHDLRSAEVLLLVRIPHWLWDLLIAESKRRGTGYMRLTRAALEHELMHNGQQVEMTGPQLSDKRGDDKR